MPSPLHIKICGLSEETTLRAAINAGADMVGFVHFEKSPRHVTLERAAELIKFLPAHIKSVLVVVNPDDALLANIASILAPDYIQLHGDETPARVAEIREQYPKQKLIKAISVSIKDDIARAKEYEALVELLLFDARVAGSGISFDWSLLQGFESRLPWMLSGGLDAKNVRDAITQTGAKMVDVSSGVESARGIKDAAKIEAFIRAAQQAR